MFTGSGCTTNILRCLVLREDRIINILLIIIRLFYINYMAELMQVFVRNVEIKIHSILILYPEVTLRAGRQTSGNQ